MMTCDGYHGDAGSWTCICSVLVNTEYIRTVLLRTRLVISSSFVGKKSYYKENTKLQSVFLSIHSFIPTFDKKCLFHDNAQYLENNTYVHSLQDTHKIEQATKQLLLPCFKPVERIVYDDGKETNTKCSTFVLRILNLVFQFFWSLEP